MTAVTAETTTVTPLVGATATVGDLLAALSVVKDAIPTRPPVPVLAGVKIDGRGDHLTLSAFDYEVSISERVEGTGVGTVLVSGRGLLDKIKGLAKPATLTLDVKGSHLHVRGDGITYKLLTMPVEDYPSIPSFNAGDDAVDKVATISGEDLARIPDIITAAGRDNTLPILTGVHFTVGAGSLRIQATDRYRYTRYMIEDPTISEWAPMPVGALYPHKPMFNVSAKTMALVAKHFKGRHVDVIVRSTHTASWDVLFTSGDLRFTTRALDGEYPRVDSLLPQDFQGVAEVDKKALVDTVKKVAKSAERNTPVELDVSGAGVVVSAGCGDEDQAVSDPIPAEHIGEDANIRFNPQYLLDGLAACGGDVTQLSIVNENKPATLVDPARPAFTYLLMPVRRAA